MYQQYGALTNQPISHSEYMQVLELRQQLLMQEYHKELKTITDIGIVNFGYSYNGSESSLNAHIRNVQIIHEKLMANQAIIEMAKSQFNNGYQPSN